MDRARREASARRAPGAFPGMPAGEATQLSGRSGSKINGGRQWRLTGTRTTDSATRSRRSVTTPGAPTPSGASATLLGRAGERAGRSGEKAGAGETDELGPPGGTARREPSGTARRIPAEPVGGPPTAHARRSSATRWALRRSSGKWADSVPDAVTSHQRGSLVGYGAPRPICWIVHSGLASTLGSGAEDIRLAASSPTRGRATRPPVSRATESLTTRELVVEPPAAAPPPRATMREMQEGDVAQPAGWAGRCGGRRYCKCTLRHSDAAWAVDPGAATTEAASSRSRTRLGLMPSVERPSPAALASE